jgi:hypothetical protein
MRNKHKNKAFELAFLAAAKTVNLVPTTLICARHATRRALPKKSSAAARRTRTKSEKTALIIEFALIIYHRSSVSLLLCVAFE